MLMPSLLGTVVCMICLMGTTWAWFADNVTTSIQSIKAADYSITVDMEDGEELEDGTYSFSHMTEGKGYQITVTANGSASTGYFKISGPDGFLPLYSTQMAPGEVMTFTFYPSITGVYDFESAWGTYSGGNTLQNNDIIGTPVQSEESINDNEEVEDTEMPSTNVESTPATKPNEEDVDEALDSGKEINNDTEGESDKIPSTVHPSQVPSETEETLPLHTSNEDSDLVENESSTLETE